MFAQQMGKVVSNRDSKDVEEYVMKFACPVIVLNGTLAVTRNAEIIKGSLSLMLWEE